MQWDVPIVLTCPCPRYMCMAHGSSFDIDMWDWSTGSVMYTALNKFYIPLPLKNITTWQLVMAALFLIHISVNNWSSIPLTGEKIELHRLIFIIMPYSVKRLPKIWFSLSSIYFMVPYMWWSGSKTNAGCWFTALFATSFTRGTW